MRIHQAFASNREASLVFNDKALKSRETIQNHSLIKVKGKMAIKEKLVDLKVSADEDDDSHFSLTDQTPIREGAFDISDEKKMAVIEKHFAAIMETLGLDLKDDSLCDTPSRVAKMFVKEIFSGLDPNNKPQVKLFKNKYKYDEMLIEKNIHVASTCEHHFLPITGTAAVAYIPNGYVVGLSKLNRIVNYYAKRPQVQERLTRQIGQELIKALGTEDVAVLVNASHQCVSSRGINDKNSLTITSFYSGKFKDSKLKKEFLLSVQQ